MVQRIYEQLADAYRDQRWEVQDALREAGLGAAWAVLATVLMSLWLMDSYGLLVALMLIHMAVAVRAQIRGGGRNV